GLTGQFYRQFAVTIAAAMIISAVNALTLTPARAVWIFKTEEGGQGHEPRREALPGWAFSIGGGILTLWLEWQYRPGHWGPPADENALPRWLFWSLAAAAFVPGAVAGGVIGWFVIGPVNAVLGWFFGGFNRAFERITALYSWAVGHALRLG